MNLMIVGDKTMACIGSFLVTLLELFDPAGGVDELLFTGEKRMAGGANFHPDVFRRGPGMVDRAARASNRGFNVVGMNVCLHY